MEPEGKDPLDELWDEIEADLMREEERGEFLGDEAKRHLSEGRAIYYCDDEYPGETVKHYPDGHREIVRIDMKTYEEIFVRDIPALSYSPAQIQVREDD